MPTSGARRAAEVLEDTRRGDCPAIEGGGRVGAVLAAMIPFALGKMIAVNPTIAVILLLVSAHGRSKALAYVIGALLGPLLTGTALLSLAATAVPSEADKDRIPLGNALQLAIGLTFLALAFRSWHQRSAPKPETPAPPEWMAMLDRISVAGALGLGALMTVIGVKNLLMLTGVVVVISDADLSFGQQEIVLAAFVLISTIPVAAPLLAAYYLGPRADGTLDGWKAWLVQNSSLIMLGFFLIFGGYFLIQGLGGLLGQRA